MKDRDEELALILNEEGLLAPLLNVALEDVASQKIGKEEREAIGRAMLEAQYPGLTDEEYEMLEYVL